METIRTVTYARVSSEKQAADDKTSIQTQLAECRTHASENGFELVKEYVEPGVSGFKYEDRPALQEMLRDAERGKFDLVLVRFFNRGGRESWMISYLRSQLKKHGVQLRILNQTLHPIIPPSKFKGAKRRDSSHLFEDAFTGAMSEYEVANLVEKSIAGKRGAIAHGKPVQSKPPYGYKIELEQISDGGKTRRKFVPKYPDYERVLELPSLVLEQHLSDLQIATLWNDRGLRRHNGGLWRSNYVQRIRENPFYCGNLVHGRYVSSITESGLTGVVKNYDLETMTTAAHSFETPWTVETFQAMQRLKESRRNRGRVVSSKNPLSGLLRCGYCNGPMYTEHPHDAKAYIECLNFRHRLTPCQSNRWPLELVWQSIIETLDTYTAEIESRDKTPQPDKPASGTLERLEKDLTTAKRKLDKEIPERLTRINYAFETGITEPDIYRTQLNQWRNDKAALSADITRLELELEQERTAAHQSETLLALAQLWQLVRAELVPVKSWNWPQELTRQLRYDILYPIFSEIRVMGVSRERYERVREKPKLEVTFKGE